MKNVPASRFSEEYSKQDGAFNHGADCLIVSFTVKSSAPPSQVARSKFSCLYSIIHLSAESFPYFPFQSSQGSLGCEKAGHSSRHDPETVCLSTR